MQVGNQEAAVSWAAVERLWNLKGISYAQYIMYIYTSVVASPSYSQRRSSWPWAAVQQEEDLVLGNSRGGNGASAETL
jgi:hypothetical protein